MIKPVVNLRFGSFHDGIVALREWGRRLAAHVVQNVPEDLSFCEYECHDPRCNSARQCMKFSSHRKSAYTHVE